jgi:hypothetical protein
MLFRTRGDETVLERHCFAFSLQIREQPCPRPGSTRVEVDDVQFLSTSDKPIKQSFAPSSRRQKEYAVFQLAKDDRINHQIRIVDCEPFHNARRRLRLRRFAKSSASTRNFTPPFEKGCP